MRDFNERVRWKDTVSQLGLTGLRFHDLRHTGSTLAARSGVSTRDLVARVGHDSVQAAIIYQHATIEADARIAASLDWEIRRDGEALLERRDGEDRRGDDQACAETH